MNDANWPSDKILSTDLTPGPSELSLEAKEAINRYLRDWLLGFGKPENQSRRIRRLRLSTLLLMVLAFCLGLSVRNIADNFHPFSTKLWLPKSDSALRPGDVLLIEHRAYRRK